MMEPVLDVTGQRRQCQTCHAFVIGLLWGSFLTLPPLHKSITQMCS